MSRLGIFVAIIILGIVAFAPAKSSYLSAFNDLYGTSGTNLDQCITCHESGSYNRNPYGSDFENELINLKDIVAALQAIENIVSDGDGDINIIEINARTFPGDPTNSTPVQHETWGAIKKHYQ